MPRSVVVSLFALLALTACSSSSGTPNDVLAPEQPEGQGQLKAGTNLYPAGPYGIALGSTIANYQFQGFANSTVARDPNALETVQLADFYNPHVDDATYAPADADHDDRLFPPGSPYGAGQPKPRVLLIDVASVWCGPCNEEAKTVLPVKYAKYSKCGGEFLLQLQDGPTPGVAALPKHLVAWTSKYVVNYPAVIDPSGKLGSLFSQAAFPANILVDTRTMQVVKSINGVPDDAFWKTFENTMNNPTCLAAP